MSTLIYKLFIIDICLMKPHFIMIYETITQVFALIDAQMSATENYVTGIYLKEFSFEFILIIYLCINLLNNAK